MMRPVRPRAALRSVPALLLAAALGAAVMPAATTLVASPIEAAAGSTEEKHDGDGGHRHLAVSRADLWTCGMHPQVVQDHPGECPICHMELTPLDSGSPGGAAGGSAVLIDPVVVQNMGVRTAAVVEGPLRREVRVAGFVVEAEPLVHDVSLRVSGWIERLHAHTEGQHVERGEPLFELYSPQLQAAVEELIALRRRREASMRGVAAGNAAGTAAADAAADATVEALWQAARRRLLLFGVDEAEVARLARAEKAPASVTFHSPVSGNVTEKPVVEGASVEAGGKVLRIVDHSTVWIDARVFEQDLALVAVGQDVEARVAAQADKVYAGKVAFVHPHLDETTRTASVRMAVPNPDLDLRPGMFASVVLRAELAPQAVLAPREAVIDTGDRQVAFVVGVRPGEFEPRRVRTGWVAEGGNVQVVEGLSPGEEVVVSGQFLLDAESRLQDALRKFLSQRGDAAPAQDDDAGHDSGHGAGQGAGGATKGATPPAARSAAAGHVHGGGAR